MPFDALTIGAVRREIEQKAVGGRVQGVLAAAPLTIGLEVYRSGVGRTFLPCPRTPNWQGCTSLQPPPAEIRSNNLHFCCCSENTSGEASYPVSLSPPLSVFSCSV